MSRQHEIDTQRLGGGTCTLGVGESKYDISGGHDIEAVGWAHPFAGEESGDMNC